MPVVEFKTHRPVIHPSAWLAPTAYVTGKTTIGEDVSIFFGSVLRGDIQAIRVGKGTNIQEHALLHTSGGMNDCVVGDFVTIGHGAIIHGCTVHDETIIGMGSTILDNAIIGKNCLIGANSLVTMNTVIPDGHLALGAPAKVIRKLNEAEIQSLRDSALHYIDVGREYARQFKA